MKQVLSEYAGMVLSAVSLCVIVVILSAFFIGKESLISQMIQFFGNGGC